MYGGYSSPPLTNNPFIADAATASVSSRFPDLSSPPQQQEQYGVGAQQGWGNTSMMGYPQQQQQQIGMYQQQQPQYSQQGYDGQPLQQPQMSGYGGGGAPSHFQPTSAFGQQLASQGPMISGSGYGYLSGQQQHLHAQQNLGYTPAQQQLQNNPGYIAQFDPYASIGQGWDGATQNHQQPQQQQQQFGGTGGMGGTPGMMQPTGSSIGMGQQTSYGRGPTGMEHPRDFVRTHKAQIEAWDNTTWRQYLNAFESLMNAWEIRKDELRNRVQELAAQMNAGMNYGPYYVAQIQQEGSRISGLQKEAEDHFDSVAASTFQMREVFEGYRQSSDLANKLRVKEATNAALKGLPGWPQPY